MRSVDHLLRPDERIRLVSREHGVVLVGAFIRATLTLVVVGGLAYELAGVRSIGVLPTARHRRWCSSVQRRVRAGPPGRRTASGSSSPSPTRPVRIGFG